MTTIHYPIDQIDKSQGPVTSADLASFVGGWAVYTDLAKLHEFAWRVAKELQDRRIAETQTKGTS